MEDEKMDNWKQFQGTELGSLMSQLYGNQNRPKINYPKPIQRKNSLPNSTFIPGGAKADAVDPRKATRKKVDVAVPKRNSYNEELMPKPIDLIPKRKNADKIKVEIDDIILRQERYRPAYTQPTSADHEKEKLSQIFTFKGGKGLPQELTHPIGETPMEITAKKKEVERMQAVRERRGLVKKPIEQRVLPMSVNDQIINQIADEVEERKKHLDEMKEIGIRPEEEERLKKEIALKISELKRAMN